MTMPMHRNVFRLCPTVTAVSLAISLNVGLAGGVAEASTLERVPSTKTTTTTTVAPNAPGPTLTTAKAMSKKGKPHRMWQKINIDKLKAASTTQPATVVTGKDTAIRTLEYEYIKKLADGGTESFSGNDFSGFIVRERHPSSLFEIYKTFHANGFLKQRANLFVKGRFFGGLEYVFDETGNLVSEINHDRDYRFTLENILRLLEKTKIDVNDVRTRIDRADTTKPDAFEAPVWVIRWSENDGGQIEVLELDGATGNVLKRSSYRMEA
jgi:hypothetical protein